MPGIFGIVAPAGRKRAQMERDALAMATVLKHRPTYTMRLYIAGDVALGRIGPSFLNPEAQPIWNEDHTRAVVFEGELFDADAQRLELTRSGHVFSGQTDAELALHAFEEAQAGGIARLRGAYVGLVYDSCEKSCHLFTDRLGLRVCYYCALDGTFIFASELKAIAATSLFRGTLDAQAAAEFLNMGFPFYDRTLFREIRFLPYGTVLTYENGRITTERYWDMPPAPAGKEPSFPDAVEEGANLLLKAVARQFRQEGTIGTLLSGGLDSRAIVAAAAAVGRPTPSYTFGNGRGTEERLASRAARKLGIENHLMSITPDYLTRFGLSGAWYTDSMLPCVHFPWLEHIRTIASRCPSILSGYLGGVFLGGLFLDQDMPENASVPDQADFIVSKLCHPISPYLRLALTERALESVEESYAASAHQLRTEVGERGFDNEVDRAYLASDEQRGTNPAIGSLIGVFVDVKYPFGDYDLLDFYLRTPPRWRRGSRIYKAILCRAFPSLVGVPCISANTRFVACRLDRQPSTLRIQWRRAREQVRFLLGRATSGRLSLRAPDTYVHHDHWFRVSSSLRQWVSSLLLSDRTLDHACLDRKGIRQLLHLEQTRGYLFGFLARLIVLEYWYRFFVDEDIPAATVK